jgi:type VII secretion-associated protein (TIGR03931 family)
VATAAAAVVALSGLYTVGAALPAAPVPLAAAGELVQYGYAVRLPSGWAHTGGLPERRRSLLTPEGAPDGGNLISVERTPLGYDADAEPQRARAELRAEFARAVVDGAPLAGFDDDARFAGRAVVAYRETASQPAGDPAGDPVQGADAAQVDWYVVLDGDAQLSVGCRHTAAGATAVAAACATVVGSLHRTS